MRRALYTDDHENYRHTVRRFLEQNVVPHIDRWEDDGVIDRDIYRQAAQAGLYALSVPETYDGSGESDFRYRLVVCEEVARVHASSFGLTLVVQDDLVLAYLTDLTTEHQREHWLPGFASGELLGSVAMTEPGAGSDLRGIRTTAVRQGDSWIINGQKTFISSGIMSDLVVVAARTDPEARSRGFSLFVVERGTPGFERGRTLDKIGLRGQDTAELFFDDARVPSANLLGEEGLGLQYLMSHLPRERLGVTATAISSARVIFDATVEYCKQRSAFGRQIAEFQNTRFELATMATELDNA